MRRSIFVTLCVLVCVAAGAGASSIDRVQAEGVSAEIVIAPDNSDFNLDAAQRRLLYRDLSAGAAGHEMINLGALKPTELEFLAEINQPESRRLLVGIDRVVDAEVDLVAREQGPANRWDAHEERPDAGLDRHPSLGRRERQCAHT